MARCWNAFANVTAFICATQTSLFAWTAHMSHVSHMRCNAIDSHSVDIYSVSHSMFSPILQWSHIQILEDIPLHWPPPPSVKTVTPKVKAKGKAKASAKAKTEPATASETTRPAGQNRPTPPAFLTNLVRCGNQMANSTSWNMVIGALESLVKQRVVILPASDICREQRCQRENRNIATLTLLGKWQPPKPGEKKSLLMESVEDLMSCLDYELLRVSKNSAVCHCHFVRIASN